MKDSSSGALNGSKSDAIGSSQRAFLISREVSLCCKHRVKTAVQLILVYIWDYTYVPILSYQPLSIDYYLIRIVEAYMRAACSAKALFSSYTSVDYYLLFF